MQNGSDYLKLADEAAAALRPVLLGSDSMIAQPGLIQRLEAAVRELMLGQVILINQRDEARAELQVFKNGSQALVERIAEAHTEIERLHQRIIDLQGGRGSKPSQSPEGDQPVPAPEADPRLARAEDENSGD